MKKREHRQDIFTNLKWKNVKQLITPANLNLLKQALDQKSAKTINEMFRQNCQTQNRRKTVIRADFNGKTSRKVNSFEVQAVKEFNLLPDILRSPLLTIKGFKSQLKEYITSTNHLTRHNNHDIH